MKTFTAPLLELAGYEEIQKKYRTKSGMTLIGGCVTSQKTQGIYRKRRDRRAEGNPGKATDLYESEWRECIQYD